MRKIIVVLLVLSLAALACGVTLDTGNQGNANTDDAVATSVAATLAAEQDNPPPDPQTGTTTGKMCAPFEGFPPDSLYLEEVNTHELTEVLVDQGSGTYSVELSPGNYIAYAWMPEYTFGGSYSQAVLCGEGGSCTDHSLIIFTVVAGQTTSNIDVCDWDGGPGSVPLPPNVDPSTLLGSISGSLSYPSEFIPPMVVVAYDVNSQDYYLVTTEQNQGTYTIEVPPGVYHVYSYVEGDNYSGAYNMAVLCGLDVSCTDATMIEVIVGNNLNVTGIDPGDWYSDQESRPPNPNN
ncbi:MAG: hypothetical protein DWQ07_03575 [Chloroflexi bacterium]|nr:MAG: hypothetical protein DWQ07_03575 [Chloroflexota bacterium]MBL1193418.1 hypothetical protein [Chloroflexota bacterium]NOH10710.1 hypothetical protein [Chloroflexota bacterium]